MKKKRIYTVATAHLDTVWSWDFETTVSKYIYNTLVDNFKLFKKYPDYVFSFEGSYRYELMEEYYPELFREMKKYIDDGRWNVTGSAFENGDVNCPSPEALFRNILFGNSYFYEKFGKRSLDIYLPDCFGFGWALPSVARHANLCGFTTQKLAWGSAYGTPFDIGKWYGVDGNFVYAVVNPHDYYFTLKKLRDWDLIEKKLSENEKYGLDWTYVFHGIGDRGGAPKEKSVKFVEGEIAKNAQSDIEVVAASADRIYKDINTSLPQSVKDKLPQWNNELVMQNHGVGGYTSRTIGKRWNDRNQELADIAERSGVTAEYLGVSNYNEDVLERAWKRVIAHQFHDDTPGTSAQRVYKRSWNDYAMSINQFSGETQAYLSDISRLMSSEFCNGMPIMVYNSIEVERRSAVILETDKLSKPFARVFDNVGNEVLSQCRKNENGIMKLTFIADMPSMGCRIFDVRESDVPCNMSSDVSIENNTMQNEKYIVTLDNNGNVSSVIDKSDNNRELLSAPVVLGLFNYTGSKDWPAWEMNYSQANKQQDRIAELVSIKIAEQGAARVAFEVIQKDARSTFKNYISLSAGGSVVEFFSEIEWQSLQTMCKNRFSFTASNPKATFDLGLGAIQRENMSEKLFEVPAQKWADITDKSGEFGISVISECKHGWDKFDDNTLRLTAIHTPAGNYRIDSMQSMMDLGLNRYSFALFSHKGTVGAQTQLQARLFTSPVTAVSLKKHSGDLGEVYSFGNVNTNDVIIRAVKKVHHSNTHEIIVRLNEGTGKPVNGFELLLGKGVESARELFASEEFKGEAIVKDGKLVCDFKPYEIKTFSLKLKENTIKSEKIKSVCVPLKYNTKLITSQNEKSENNYNVPREIIPSLISVGGVDFEVSDSSGKNAVITDKTEITISSDCTALYLLCASNGDKNMTFTINERAEKRMVCDLLENYAGWDLYDLGETAYVKDAKLGFEATHSHDADGNDLYAKGMYFCIVTLPVKKGDTVKLPDALFVLSACESVGTEDLLTPLSERVENNRPLTFKMNLKEKLRYINSKMVWSLHDRDNFISHWNNGKNGKRVEQTGNRARMGKYEK